MTKLRMTLEQHLELAPTIRNIKEELQKNYIKTANRFPKKDPVRLAFCKALSSFDALQSCLDVEYHKVISDNDFRTHGHIYFVGPKGERDD